MTCLLPSPTPFLIESKCAIYWMLGSLAQAQESSECEVSLKGILHQPVDVCLPRGSFTGKVEKKRFPANSSFGVGGPHWTRNRFLLFKTGRPWMEVSDVMALFLSLLFLSLFIFFFKNESSECTSLGVSGKVLKTAADRTV